MKNGARGAVWVAALMLVMAGLVAMPREGAAFTIKWQDGPWEVGEPDIPDGRAKEIYLIYGAGTVYVFELAFPIPTIVGHQNRAPVCGSVKSPSNE